MNAVVDALAELGIDAYRHAGDAALHLAGDPGGPGWQPGAQRGLTPDRRCLLKWLSGSRGAKSNVRATRS